MAFEFKEYNTRDLLMAGLATTVKTQLRTALEIADHASLAVPGGTTPAPFFAHLRMAELDWGKVSVLLTDERCVPESSDRSNTRLVRQSLLQDAAKSAILVPMIPDTPANNQVSSDILAGVNKVLPLDICVLGMGADMHTASLFPGADKLELALSDTAPAVLPMRTAGAPEARVTLTAPVIRNAKAVHVLITSPQKLDAYHQALAETDTRSAPIRVALTETQNVTVHYAA